MMVLAGKGIKGIGSLNIAYDNIQKNIPTNR